MGKILWGDKPKVYDLNGDEKDWAWLNDPSRYPATGWADASGSPKYQLVAVREREGPMNVEVRVIRDINNMYETHRIGLWWATGGVLVPPLTKSQWYPRVGVIQQTAPGTGGTVFEISSDSHYSPDGQSGPHWAWVLSNEYESDALARFGWKWGTNHRGPLCLDFMLVWKIVPPPDTPPQPFKLLWNGIRLPGTFTQKEVASVYGTHDISWF